MMNIEKADKKQIEEMGQIICGRYENGICLIDKTSCYGLCEELKAEKLYNAGYRKADEVRKETAKKIFDVLYQGLDLENTEKGGFVTIQKFDFLNKFRELYQQLCIEPKE